MPKFKLIHNSSRALVCLICWHKIFGKGGRILKHDDKLTQLIKTKYNILNQYNPSDLSLPNSICCRCRISLIKCETNNEVQAPLIKACVYGTVSAPSLNTLCSDGSPCLICKTAKLRYRPSSRAPCSCRTCNEYHNLHHNLPSTSSTDPSNNNQAAAGPLITTSNLLNMQAKSNLSNKQILNIATSLRSICGHKAVESRFREKLTEVSRKLESFYLSVSSNFKINDTDGYSKRILVYCNDVEGLVNFILKDREYDPFNHLIRIGLDGGGDFSKSL